MELITFLIPLVIAFFTCFYGYKMNRILIALASFVLGFSLGYSLANLLIGSHEVCLCIGALIGIMAGFTGFKLYLLGIFLLCFLSVLGIAKIYIENTVLMWAVGIIGGTILGLLGTKFVRPVMILTTSISGATTLATLFFSAFKFQNTYLFLAQIILAGIGIFFQFNQKEK